MQVKNVFLLDYPLVFFLLKPRSIVVFWNQKKSGPNRNNPLNSSIDIGMCEYFGTKKNPVQTGAAP